MFCAVWSMGKVVVSPDTKPSLASMSREPLMLVTCKLMFCKEGLLLTLKVETDCKLLIPCNELSPVLVMRMLFALLIPLPPKDNCCNAGKAVKLNEETCVSRGNESWDNSVKPSRTKPPIDLRSPKDKLERLAALLMVKLPVMASTVSTDSV